MTAEYFDQWYAAMSADSPRDRLWQDALGLPREMVSSSLLPLSGLRDIGALLALRPDEVLLDLACGRGGYGMWLARDSGAQVVGVDFSPTAVADAERRVADFGLRGRATYRVGDLLDTGLPDESVDAVMCVDAVQFAADPTLAAKEMRRVLRPGRRVALSCWEPRDRSDRALPDRLRSLELSVSLTAAGLVDVRVEERADWHEVERRLWAAVMSTEPGDDQALHDAREEAERVSQHVLDGSRRVLATATAP